MYVSQMYFKNFTFGGLSFEDSSTLCTTSEETSGNGLLFSYRHIWKGNLHTLHIQLTYITLDNPWIIVLQFLSDFKQSLQILHA